MKILRTCLSLACASLLYASFCQADDFAMEPGKWEFTHRVQMPMVEQPQSTTATECISKEDLNDPLARLVDDGNCRIIEKSMQGDQIRYVMECSEDGVTMRGEGKVTGRGKTASGFMEMSADLPEVESVPNMPQMGGIMRMTAGWEGRWLGPCDQ